MNRWFININKFGIDDAKRLTAKKLAWAQLFAFADNIPLTYKTLILIVLAWIIIVMYKNFAELELGRQKWRLRRIGKDRGRKSTNLILAKQVDKKTFLIK